MDATRDNPTFRAIRDDYPDFDLAAVDGATGAQKLVWQMRVRFDGICERDLSKSCSLDEYVAAQLEASADVAAPDARAWLLDPKARVYKPRPSQKIAREFVEQQEPAFEFSTDADLSERLGEVEWLWENYIPRGFVTGLVGPQDGGKSTVAQNFCQTVLIGGRWPDGQTCSIEADKLLWIDTDGNLALFHQRLKAWKMPTKRFIFPPDALMELTIDDPQSWRWIERAVEKFQIQLVVIDALSGSHNGKSNDEDSMKVIMKRLHALAQKYKIAIVVIHHLNKAPVGVPAYPLTIDRLRGSSSISQFCRSILALTTPDPARPDDRRLDVIKLNLARKPGPVGYTLGDTGPMWGDAPEPAQPRRAADDAADFLRAELAKGARPAGDLREKAIAQGLSDYALKQARKEIGVENEKSRVPNGGWLWALPPENEPKH